MFMPARKVGLTYEAETVRFCTDPAFLLVQATWIG